MATKNDSKQLQMQILPPVAGFPRSMFFNRFRIERESGFVIVRFGLVAGSDDLQDHFSCVFSNQALEEAKSVLLPYFDQLQQRPVGRMDWKKTLPSSPVCVVDIVSMVTRNDISETVLSLISHYAAMRMAGGQAKIGRLDAEPVILLRSATEVQMQLVQQLYDEE